MPLWLAWHSWQYTENNLYVLMHHSTVNLYTSCAFIKSRGALSSSNYYRYLFLFSFFSGILKMVDASTATVCHINPVLGQCYLQNSAFRNFVIWRWVYLEGLSRLLVTLWFKSEKHLYFSERGVAFKCVEYTSDISGSCCNVVVSVLLMFFETATLCIKFHVAQIWYPYCKLYVE